MGEAASSVRKSDMRRQERSKYRRPLSAEAPEGSAAAAWSFSFAKSRLVCTQPFCRALKRKGLVFPSFATPGSMRSG